MAKFEEFGSGISREREQGHATLLSFPLVGYSHQRTRHWEGVWGVGDGRGGGNQSLDSGSVHVTVTLASQACMLDRSL